MFYNHKHYIKYQNLNLEKKKLVSSKYWDMSGNGHALHILIRPTRDTGNWFTSSLFTLRNLFSNASTGWGSLLDYGDLKRADPTTRTRYLPTWECIRGLWLVSVDCVLRPLKTLRHISEIKPWYRGSAANSLSFSSIFLSTYISFTTDSSLPRYSSFLPPTENSTHSMLFSGERSTFRLDFKFPSPHWSKSNKRRSLCLTRVTRVGTPWTVITDLQYAMSPCSLTPPI
jgi:hypothetical protein